MSSMIYYHTNDDMGKFPLPSGIGRFLIGYSGYAAQKQTFMSVVKKYIFSQNGHKSTEEAEN